MNSTSATTAAKPVTPAAAPSATAKPVTAAKKAAPAKVAVKKAAAKPAAKPATKPVAKAVAKPVSKPKAKPSVKPAAKPVKVKKPKMVRDSFTMPKAEFAVIEALKVRAAALKVPTKKTEMIRAGIKALAAMSDAAFLNAVRAVPNLKTGRPAKGE
jgi:hypothetical protein